MRTDSRLPGSRSRGAEHDGVARVVIDDAITDVRLVAGGFAHDRRREKLQAQSGHAGSAWDRRDQTDHGIAGLSQHGAVRKSDGRGSDDAIGVHES